MNGSKLGLQLSRKCSLTSKSATSDDWKTFAPTRHRSVLLAEKWGSLDVVVNDGLFVTLFFLRCLGSVSDLGYFGVVIHYNSIAGFDFVNFDLANPQHSKWKNTEFKHEQIWAHKSPTPVTSFAPTLLDNSHTFTHSPKFHVLILPLFIHPPWDFFTHPKIIGIQNIPFVSEDLGGT